MRINIGDSLRLVVVDRGEEVILSGQHSETVRFEIFEIPGIAPDRKFVLFDLETFREFVEQQRKARSITRPTEPPEHTPEGDYRWVAG